MADLAGGAPGAVEELVVDDDAGADTRGDLHEDRAVVAAAHALPVLGEGAEVGVVLDVDGEAELLLGGGAAVHALPAGEDRRGADDVVGDRRRAGPSRCGGPRPWSATIASSIVPAIRQRLGVVVAGLEPAPFLGQQAPGQVADGHRHVAVAEVDARHEPGAAGQPHRGAAPSAARVGLDQAGGGELADDVRDRGGGQPGGAGQLGLGELAVAVVGSPVALPRSTSRTRCWFAVRSEDVDPGAGSVRRRGMDELCTQRARCGQDVTINSSNHLDCVIFAFMS